MELRVKINEAFKYIESKTKYNPKLGIILGTGFGDIANLVEEAEFYKYRDIPYFSEATVEGHEGTLVIGKIHNVEVVIMKGRFHYYEGHSTSEITLPVRVMKLLGVKDLIITNCGGQANPNIKAGDLFILTNHINLSGINPLIGKNLDEFGERFPDLAYPYNEELRESFKAIARKKEITIKEGVYAMFSGPSYETATETIMASRLGADVVGMSTVSEVIIANHCGIKVVALSGIPCLAAAYSNSEITHEEVMENCKIIYNKLNILIDEFIKSYNTLN